MKGKKKIGNKKFFNNIKQAAHQGLRSGQTPAAVQLPSCFSKQIRDRRTYKADTFSCGTHVCHRCAMDQPPSYSSAAQKKRMLSRRSCKKDTLTPFYLKLHRGGLGGYLELAVWNFKL